MSRKVSTPPTLLPSGERRMAVLTLNGSCRPALLTAATGTFTIGVPVSSVTYFTGGEEEPGRPEKIKLDLPREIRVERIGGNQTLSAMLADGEIDALYTTIMETLNHAIVRKPVFSEVKVDVQRVDMVQQAMQLHYGSPKTYPVIANREVANRLTDPESFSSISSAYTPDHIVYSGFKPLWIDETVFGQDEPVQAMVSAMRTFEQMHGVPAKIIAVQKTAAFAVSEAALVLFLDTVKVSAFTESFGGPRFMDDDQIDFIRTWEVEQYRSNLNA